MARTRIATIRLEDKDLDDLQKLARQDGISTNALINQILKSHLEWERIAPLVGLIPIQKRIIRDLLDYIPEEEVKRIAIKDADFSMGDLQMFTGKSDLESFLWVTRLRVKKSGFAFTEDTDDEDNLTLISHHGMGRKWSAFFGVYNQRIVESLGYQARTDIQENLWITRIVAR